MRVLGDACASWRPDMGLLMQMNRGPAQLEQGRSTLSQSTSGQKGCSFKFDGVRRDRSSLVIHSCPGYNPGKSNLLGLGVKGKGVGTDVPRPQQEGETTVHRLGEHLRYARQMAET